MSLKIEFSLDQWKRMKFVGVPSEWTSRAIAAAALEATPQVGPPPSDSHFLIRINPANPWMEGNAMWVTQKEHHKRMRNQR